MANRTFDVIGGTLLGFVGVLLCCCGGREGSSVSGGAAASAGVPSSGGSGATGLAGTGAAPTGGTAGTGGAANMTGGAGGSSGGAAGATSDWTICSTAGDCVLQPTGCCTSPCEPAPITAFTAVNSSKLSNYQQTHPPCDCTEPACPSVMPDERNRSNYLTVCEAGRCMVVDIRSTPLTACASDSECYLHNGTGCACAVCSTSFDNLVAFSTKGNTAGAVEMQCGGGCVDAPCPAGSAPATAYCAIGHCRVRFPIGAQ